jgi:hypothetical protein
MAAHTLYYYIVVTLVILRNSGPIRKVMKKMKFSEQEPCLLKFAIGQTFYFKHLNFKHLNFKHRQHCQPAHLEAK